jgi:hypothetical protein
MAPVIAPLPTFLSTPVAEDRDLLHRLFADWQQWPGREAKFKVVPVIDTETDQYLLLTVGWDGYRRIYGVLVHVLLRDGKFWIEEDNTKEGFATDLLDAGVPKERIVLSFQHPERRKWGEFAVE